MIIYTCSLAPTLFVLSMPITSAGLICSLPRLTSLCFPFVFILSPAATVFFKKSIEQFTGMEHYYWYGTLLGMGIVLLCMYNHIYLFFREKCVKCVKIFYGALKCAYLSFPRFQETDKKTFIANVETNVF